MDDVVGAVKKKLGEAGDVRGLMPKDESLLSPWMFDSGEARRRPVTIVLGYPSAPSALLVVLPFATPHCFLLSKIRPQGGATLDQKTESAR